MALQKPSSGLPPAENYRRFGAAFDAIDTAAGTLGDTNVRLQTNINALGTLANRLGETDIRLQTSINGLGELNNEVDQNNLRLQAAINDLGTLANTVSTNKGELINALEAVRTALTNLLTAETDERRQFETNETSERRQGDANEAAERRQGIANLRSELTAAVAKAVDALTKADAAESTARRDADAALSGRIDRKAEQADLARAQADLSAARQALAEVMDTLADLLSATERRRIEFTRNATRPGEAPIAFALVDTLSALAGPPLPLPPVPGALVRPGDAGDVVRLTGGGVVATRSAVAVERARAYRLRGIMQRRANPSDPSNDAVQLVLVCLDQNLSRLPGGDGLVMVADLPELKVADGRREFQATFTLDTVSGAMLRLSRRTRFVRAAIRTFGFDGITDAEVLGIEDVTSATLLDPVSSDALSRLGAIEAGDPLGRLDVLEANAGQPSSVTFRTKADASAATIPETVATVRLLGAAAVNDGRDGLYARFGGEVPAGADIFVSKGATWMRVPTAQDLFDATFTPLVAGWFAGLPTAPPATAGKPWNNGGMVSFS